MIQAISTFSDIVEICVGLTALWVAWTQRDKISTAFSILLGYSLQTSLGDLRHWLERLQEHNIDGTDESSRVRRDLAYIRGKIKGNKVLYTHFGDKILKRVNEMIGDLDQRRPVSETSKISLCSEIKERLATLEVENRTLKSNKYE
jgi:hypothetical protein